VRTYILAEIACAHMGDVEIAKELMNAAGEAGAHGVKIQVWFPEELKEDMTDKYLGGDGYRELFRYSQGTGVQSWWQYYGPRSQAFVDRHADPYDVLISHDKPGFVGWQDYPTKITDHPLRDVNSDRHSYADHTHAGSPMRFVIPAMAVAKGARLIEKHICLNRTELRKCSKDWVSALEPDEFRDFVEFIRLAEQAL